MPKLKIPDTSNDASDSDQRMIEILLEKFDELLPLLLPSCRL